jgi:preprotein translocase subunit SecF
MWIIKNRKIFYTFSSILVAVVIGLLFTWGIRFGIDFTGGSLLELEFDGKVPTHDELYSDLESYDFLAGYSLRSSGETGEILRTKEITDEQKNTIISGLQESYSVTESRFSSIGPTLGDELKTKAILAVVLALFFIVMFIAFAFRHVSKPVSSWSYGGITVVAFLHDLIIPLGAFSIMGHFVGLEVDSLFITALLVILGYSINDTIVVIDRIRENLSGVSEELKDKKFESVVGKSVNETISRSINTSLTTLIALTALYVYGGSVTQAFALALIVGVLAGTYSSIFLASPLLVSLNNMSKK